jgi:hypothetical protein
MLFVLFAGSGKIASDERSPLRGGGTQGQDFQARGENIFFIHIGPIYSGPVPVLFRSYSGPKSWSESMEQIAANSDPGLGLPSLEQ